MIALSNSIHLYARPDAKENFLKFFTGILGLEAAESSDTLGSPEPIYGFKFSNGASLSVEFTEDARRGTSQGGSPVHSVLLYPGTRRTGVQVRLKLRILRCLIE